MRAIRSLIALIAVLSTGLIACQRENRAEIPLVVADELIMSGPHLEIDDIADLTVADDGHIVLANPFGRPFALVDPEWKKLRQVGTRGNGPAEMVAPLGVVSLTASTHAVTTYDAGRRALVQVDSSGNAEVIMPLRIFHGFARSDFSSVSYGAMGRIREIDSGYVVFHHLANLTTTASFKQAILVHHTPGGTADTLMRFAEVEPAGRPAPPHWLVTVPHWDTCDNGDIVAVNTANDTLYRWTRRLKTEWERPDAVELLLPRASLTNEALYRYLNHVIGLEAREAESDTSGLDVMINRVIRNERDRYASLLPAISELRCGTDGDVWLQEFTIASSPIGYGETWLVLSRNGAKPVMRVKFPVRFKPYVLTTSHAIGVQRDTLDVARLAMVKWNGVAARGEEPRGVDGGP